MDNWVMNLSNPSLGVCYMDYIHYSFNKIFIDHSEYETEVELESLHKTGIREFNDENP